MIETIINAIKRLIASGTKTTIVVDLKEWSNIDKMDLKWIFRSIKTLEFPEEIYWKLKFRINDIGTVTLRYDPDGVKPNCVISDDEVSALLDDCI